MEHESNSEEGRIVYIDGDIIRKYADALRSKSQVQKEKIVVLFSGGVDSAATAKTLVDAGYDVHPLYIHHGQLCAEVERKVASMLSLAITGHHLHEIWLHDLRVYIQKAMENHQAWIPFRNTLFLLHAALYAENMGTNKISLGFMSDDQGVFGDNCLQHHAMISDILRLSANDPGWSVLTPLGGKNKREVIKILGKDLFNIAVSCWNAHWVDTEKTKYRVCEKCANCRERIKYAGEVFGS